VSASANRSRVIICLSLTVGATLATLAAGCGGAVSPLGSNQPSLTTPTLDGGRAANVAAGITAPAGTVRRAGVFVAGGAPVGYAHAWVTLNKIEVVDTSEKPTPIWESRDGLAVDLATLRDHGGPLYGLITSAAVPSGRAHKRVRVTIGKAVLLYEPGATVAKTFLVSDALPRDDEGRPVLSYALAKAHDLGSGKEDVVIALDPAKIVLNGDRIKLAVSDGSRAARAALASGTSRQIPGLFSGTVDEVTRGGVSSASVAQAPDKSMKRPMTDGAPPPSGSGPAGAPAAGSPAAFAAAGAVRPMPGMSPSATTTVATKQTGKKTSAPEEDGAPTFTLKDANGQTVIVQSDKTVAVAMESAAVAPEKGKAETTTAAVAPAGAAALTEGKRVWVRGVLAEGSKRIVATEIVLLPTQTASATTDTADGGTDTPAAPTDDAAAIGAASSAKPEAATFTLAPRQVYGLVPSQSAFTVVLRKGAILTRLQGGPTPISADDLFAALKGSDVAIEAAGAYDPMTGTLTATRVTLDGTPAAPAATAATKVSSTAR